jgi:transcriptional regulator with XRE-family HTH domain
LLQFSALRITMVLRTTPPARTGQNKRQHYKPGIIGMNQSEERPVNCQQAREVLGWGSSYMSAVRRAMGITSRYFFLTDVRKFIRSNPNFTSTQIYHRNTCKCEVCKAKPAKIQTMKPKSKNSNHSSAAPVAPPANSAVVETYSSPDAKLLGDKLKALRGSMTVAELAKRTGLSRETIRKAECGTEATLLTLQSVKAALCKSETDWTELLLFWFKFQLGDDANNLSINVSPTYVAKMSHQLSDIIVDHFRALDAEHQRFVVELVQSKERVEALWKYENLRASIPELQKLGLPVGPDAFVGVEEPLNGPWATL